MYMLTCLICNYNMDAKHLDKGQVVGKLYPVESSGSNKSFRENIRTG